MANAVQPVTYLGFKARIAEPERGQHWRY